MKTRSELESKFAEIYGYSAGDSYEIRIFNALESICRGQCREEEIIEIFDTSVFSNGKAGLVLGCDSIYVNDVANFTPKFNLQYSDIAEMKIEGDRFLGLDLTALIITSKSGREYKVSINPSGLEKLKSFLEYARG